MRVLGLTGGIASGKTTVSNILKKLGANVIDTDAIAHELAEIDKPLWLAYTAHFGDDILLPDRTLNRKLIAKRIFEDLKEREWIDNTAHPIIYKRVKDDIVRLAASGEKAVVLDVPLLFETNFQKLVDVVWVVYVSRETQMRRLMERDNVDRLAAEARLNAQMPLEEKRKLADFVIYNEATTESLEKAVNKAWMEFLAV